MFFHYVGIESVEIAKQRIAYRVAHGGHGIPDADVERRYKNGDLYILSDQIPMWFEKYIK